MTTENPQPPEVVPIYCQCCNFPVHYCKYIGNATKRAECFTFLKDNYPDLVQLIYPAEAEKLALIEQEKLEKKEQISAELVEAQVVQNPEDNKERLDEDEGEEDEEETEVPQNKEFKINPKLVPPFGVCIKPNLRKQATYNAILQVRKASRGGTKCMTQVFNFQDFPQITEEVCRQLARNLGVGVGFSELPDTNEPIIMIQGDYVTETILYFTKIGVPRGQIFIAADGKHKGKRKQAAKSHQGHQQRGQQQ